MKKNIKVIFLLLLPVLNFAFAQKSIIPKYIREDKKNIIGTWVSEEDKNWKQVFTANGKCYDYYSDTLVSVSRYKISNNAVQCGHAVFVGEKQKTDYLELTDTKDNYKMCYEINGVTNVLSLMYLESGHLIVMDKIKVQKHTINKNLNTNSSK